MSAARVAVAADVLHGRMPGRNNSSASVAAMAVRSVRSAAAVHSHSVLPSNGLPSSKGRRSSNRHRRKPKASGRAAVAAAVAVADQESPLQPVKVPHRSSRVRRASRVLPVRPRPPARILSLPARKAEHHAPRATVQKGVDASGGAEVGAVVADPRLRRHRCGYAEQQ